MPATKNVKVAKRKSQDIHLKAEITEHFGQSSCIHDKKPQMP
jgi:hypothetical protein